MDLGYQISYTIALFYVLAILLILFIRLSPLKFLVLYGKTYSNKTKVKSKYYDKVDIYLGNLTVPKRYFSHFYIIFFTLNCVSIATSRSVWVKDFLFQDDSSIIRSKYAIIIAFLILIQSFRRLLECLFLVKFSPTAKMNILHYLMGYFFYILVALNSFLYLMPSSLIRARFNLGARDVVLLLLFGVTSYGQFSVHSYLAHLKKYTLPDFKVVSSPHYSYEVLIYFIIFLFSTIDQEFTIYQVNFCLSFIFVLVTLSISSLETHQYYKKYETFSTKSSIIPGIL